MKKGEKKRGYLKKIWTISNNLKIIFEKTFY
jgi:hypothetical protein